AADGGAWHRACAGVMRPPATGRSGETMASANITHSSSAPSERALLLKRRARFMRHHPTASEYRLWLVLSGSKLGVPFRRQVVIGDFIADFCCKKLKLIVEVDGGYHEHRVRLDAARVRKLQRAG